MFFFTLLIASCASQPTNREVSLKSIGEDVCLDHGGLASIDKVGTSAVYLCRHGMSYQLSTKDASTLLNNQ